VSIVITSAAVLGKSELGRARSDPRIRAEIERDNQRAREALLRELARLEKYYRAMPEPEAENWEAAVGRDLILKMIPITRENLEHGSRTWWNPEIAAIRRLHERVSLALEADTRRGLMTLESARKGHLGRYGSSAEKRKKYQPVVDKIASSNPRLSRREINTRAGQVLGVSYKAVERHTTDPRKK
jgi:hypothetical protein